MFVAIVPAYNEEERIGSVVRSLFEQVDQVVVIDDSSSDNTREEARAAGAIVLTHEINRGQGAALETGHMYARLIGADYVVHFDGDGQFSVDDIESAYRHLQEMRVDIVFGSRYLQKQSRLPWFKRFILHPLGKLVDRLFGGLRLSDAHNGFRLMNRTALDRLILRQDRMAHASEIPALVRKHNLRHSEIPVSVTYHEYGQSAAGGFRVVQDLVVDRFIK